ncbi:TPA: insulinase family protein [Pseudomonas aeruginosa]|nr:insulinase family protein [Pseudomonas aeruginosa]
MVKRYAILALFAVSTSTALAGGGTLSVPLRDQPVKLQAIVSVGTTSVCGMREAPHLIEHLLLSDTHLGETPVDAILALRAKGIKLSALTRSDFTEYTLEGPASKASAMGEALVTFLSRPSIPKTGFEREKRVIVSEVMADSTYVSSPTLYERFVAAKAGGHASCSADSQRLLDYRFEDVQSVYRTYYTPDTVRILASAEPGVFDLGAISQAIWERKGIETVSSHNGTRETASALEVFGRPGIVELIFPISGRATLPSDAANALADQARLEVQAYIRRTHQLYAARSFVDQSIQGGWIRIEVPGLGNDEAQRLATIAQAAMRSIDLSLYGEDPLWQSYGASTALDPVGAPVIPAVRPAEPNWLRVFATNIWSFFTGLWS